MQHTNNQIGKKGRKLCEKPVLYKQCNPEKVKTSRQKSSATYRQLHPEQAKAFSKIADIQYRQNHPDNYRISQEKQYLKRKLGDSEIELELRADTHKVCKNSSNPPRSIGEDIEMFHKNISFGPKYICTCCEQLWYRSSVTKCSPDFYKSCSRDIFDTHVTGLKSIDNTEWICATCRSNLKSGKLPSCARANKITFPEKNRCLNESCTSCQEFPSCKYGNCLVVVN